MPHGYQRILTTGPDQPVHIRFIATRSERNIVLEDFDEPQLKTLRVGVFQHSAFREALARHGKKEGLDIHVIRQKRRHRDRLRPWRQVQKVVVGEIDAAGVWGPFAGWVKKQGAPLTLYSRSTSWRPGRPWSSTLAFGVRTNDPC